MREENGVPVSTEDASIDAMLGAADARADALDNFDQIKDQHLNGVEVKRQIIGRDERAILHAKGCKDCATHIRETKAKLFKLFIDKKRGGYRL